MKYEEKTLIAYTLMIGAIVMITAGVLLEVVTSIKIHEEQLIAKINKLELENRDLKLDNNILKMEINKNEEVKGNEDN